MIATTERDLVNARLVDLYKRFHETLLISASLYGAISPPLCLKVHPDWLDSRFRILIVGQETMGWGLDQRFHGSACCQYQEVLNLAEWREYPDSVSALLHVGGDRAVTGLRLADPDAAGDVASEVDGRCADDETVEVFGKALSFLHALTAAGGAADPVGIARRGSVVGLDHLLRENGGFVNGEPGEIEELAACVEIGGGFVSEAGKGILCSVVPGIGGGRCEAMADRAIDRSETDGTGGAAVAHHLEAFVPFGGELDGELIFGPDDAADVAVLGEIALGGDERGRADFDFIAEVVGEEGIAGNGGFRGVQGGAEEREQEK